jgi:hypothetical protein
MDLKFTTCGDYMSEEKYVVVTCTSTFRQRYCVPVSKLQELNTDVDITDDSVKQIEWANDSVTMEEVKEFSQHWLGETILDTFILDEERVLKLFDRDNQYLSDWTEEKKLEWIHDWKDNWKEKESKLDSVLGTKP